MMSFLMEETRAGRLPANALVELTESEAGRAEKLRAAPQFVQRSLVGAYLLGQIFLLQGDAAALVTGIRPKDLDRAFESPPASTEQILHPEKYWDRSQRDEPREVALPDLSSELGDGWSLETSGVLGELILAIVAGAEPIDPTSVATDHYTNGAASGWGGDLWHLYADGDRKATLLATLWDSEADAGEFKASLAPSATRVVAHRGEVVVMVAGLEGDDARRLAMRALASLAPGVPTVDPPPLHPRAAAP
jgi:hypothetical protein